MISKELFPFDIYFKIIILTNLFITFLSLLFCFILSFLMNKYRINKYLYDGRGMYFAPVWKRAMAKILDTFIIIIPVIALFYLFNIRDIFIKYQSDTFEYFFVILMIILFCFAILYGILIIVLFSLLEGKWGQTPGKFLLGIKVVGLDLNLCGFGQAFIRNILLIVDGAFTYMVGLLIIAFSKNWQRIGDMIARTLVVQIQKQG